MRYKEVEHNQGWSIQIGSNENTRWRLNHNRKSFWGQTPFIYLNISNEDMNELYKCEKFKEIVRDTDIEQLIQGKFPKGWKTPEQLQEEITKKRKTTYLMEKN
tara:strand:- start:169 stop:477 length:309 start_codon:yes stop_codon:yes gene_type:complete